MEMILHLTLTEILAFTGIMITLVSGYVVLKMKIQKIETTSQLKFLEIEAKIMASDKSHDRWVDDIKEMVHKFLTENKEEHGQLIHSVGSMRSSLEFIKIRLAEKGMNMHVTIDENKQS